MATLKICKLHFTAPLHIGDLKNDDYGISQRTITSDTMYAAMTAVLAKTGVSLPVDGDLGFTISSLFPYYQESATSPSVYFFPQPLQAQMPHLEDLGERKKVKKVKWLDTQYYERVLNGVRLFGNSREDICSIHGEYLSKADVPSDFIKSQVIQRVTLKSRIGAEDALPYYVDRVSFRDFAGLYFIVEGNTDLLEKAMTLLSLEGIGTDRNVGNGFFDYEMAELNVQLPASASHAVFLSLMIPESKEQFEALVDSDLVAYDIERRGGWITTYPFQTLRKNAIYGFTSGSVFAQKVSGVETIGRIVNLRPDVEFTEEKLHPIWRSGKSILLPIIL